MKTGEPGLRARAVFPSEAAIRALQQPHRGRRALAVPSAPGLSWLTPFLVSLLLCAGLALTPAQTEAAYAATELASLPVGSSHVVRAANDAGEIVGTPVAANRGFLLKVADCRRSQGCRVAITAPPSASTTSAKSWVRRTPPLGCGLSAPAERPGSLPSARSQATTAAWRWPSTTRDRRSAIRADPPGFGPSSGPPRAPSRRYRCFPAATRARGLAINDGGDVVGVSDTPSGPRAVLWEGDAVQDLGTLPGHGASEALSINANGVIVGSSGDPEAQRHAVLWAVGRRPHPGSRHASGRHLEPGARDQ